MALRIQQDVIRLYVPVHDPLLVYISDGAPQLSYPKPDGLLGEGLTRDVEAEIAAVH